MLVAERREKIIDIVNNKKSIRVTELSEFFSVTEETIRRDLESLEKDKKIRRSHGGALSIVTSDTTEIPYFEREIINIEEKKEISLEAVKFVSKGDKIFLDASTTAWYMAQQLPNITLTVVTNSLKVALELSDKNKIKVLSTGGKLLKKSLSYVGSKAEQSVDNYHVDKAFISCKGLHISYGLSESHEQQAVVKEKMLQNAAESYIMIDNTKIGVKSFSRIGNLDLIDTIITDSQTKQELIQYFEEKDVPVIQPD